MYSLRSVSGGKILKIIIIGAFINMIVYLIWFTNQRSYYLIRNPIKVTNKSGNIIILQWTNSDSKMFTSEGQKTFFDIKCPVRNCFMTTDKSYFNSETEFDVILFHEPELYRKNVAFPKQRSADQKYVFASMESSDYYPICDNKFNGYFNWTWTYKLNSDGYFGYMIIRNKQGEVIGPKEVMHWTDVAEMSPVDEDLKAKLSTKTKAVAWFVSNCNAPSGRQIVAKQLQQELAKYNMTLDIYGGCGTMSCSFKSMEQCLRMVERDYYYYLSFENSFSDDYVTEKLLHPLQHYTVPVVFGGANYTRFMPNGIYLGARKHSPKYLAEQMNELIEDKEKYYNYFRWHNHYTYHNLWETVETNYYCRFCEKLNNATAMKERKVYDNFMHWWNPKTLRQNVCTNK